MRCRFNILATLSIAFATLATGYANIECDPSDPMPQKWCHAAHKKQKPIDPVHESCHAFGGECVPGSGSRCEGWFYEVVREGVCEDGGGPHDMCIEDDSIATFEVVKLERKCRFEPPGSGQDCGCHYNEPAKAQQETVIVHVCDCAMGSG